MPSHLHDTREDDFSANAYEAEEYASGEEYREQLTQLTPAHQSFGWRQKVSVLFLALFGVSAVVLWGVQFKNNLGGRQPVASSLGENAGEDSEAARLRGQDTDGDGLIDYEELQFYKTSPYLADSDSDGVSDYDELQAREDPNCPRGTECAQSEFVPAATAPTAAPREPAVNSELRQLVDNGGDGSALEAILTGEADPVRLRALLLEAGMNKGTLDSFTDEQLLEVYNNTLESYQ
jgi:hypothetical protein